MIESPVYKLRPPLRKLQTTLHPTSLERSELKAGAHASLMGEAGAKGRGHNRRYAGYMCVACPPFPTEGRFYRQLLPRTHLLLLHVWQACRWRYSVWLASHFAQRRSR
jgi:hypothetical protein